MAFVQVAQLQSPAWVAGATQQIETDRLPSVADGMPLHIACIDCEICLNVTDDDDTEEPGVNLIDCLDQLVIRDILGNEIVRLSGRHLQMLIKMGTDWRHADPAALPGTGSGALVRSIQFRIPFHGGAGGIGGTAFTPVVNWPEVAILGIARSSTEPVWLDGQFQPRLMLPLALSYDHRVIGGIPAIKCLQRIKQLLQDAFRLT